MANKFILPGIFETNLEPSQKAAIRHGIYLGIILQTQHPGIEEDFRDGKSLREIVEEHNFEEKFGISHSTAQMAVTYALRGYRGDWEMFKEIFYEGLMEPEDYTRISEEHHVEQGRKLGKEVGYKSGQLTLERKTGVHAMSYIEKHKAGQKGILEQGHTLVK